MNASNYNCPSCVKDEAAAVKPVREVIESHPFLKGMRPDHLALLAHNALRLDYEPGELIFREGDPANRFYLLESGKVSLETRPVDGPTEPVQVIGPGDVIGWSWLFPPYYWKFDGRVVEPATAIFFYGARLREACEADHDFGYDLIKRMARIAIERLQTTRKWALDKRR